MQGSCEQETDFRSPLGTEASLPKRQAKKAFFGLPCLILDLNVPVNDF